MTEAEWLSSNDPAAMLQFLRFGAIDVSGFHGVSERKLRLFACAVIRLWGRLASPRVLAIDNLTAVVGAEAYADGLRPDLPRIDPEWFGEWVVRPNNQMPDSVRAILANCNEDELPGVAAILRDVIGNPFRPGGYRHLGGCLLVVTDRVRVGHGTTERAVVVNWLTPTILGLAGHIYQARDFAAMPVLADALEDAGCTDALLLGHLRDWNPHVRGCWALDLILGKS